MRKSLVILVFLGIVAAGFFGLSRLIKWRKPIGKAPAASVSKPSKDEMVLSIYFPHKEGTELVEEKRVVAKPSGVLAGINLLLLELHKGPEKDELRTLFPEDTFPRTVFLSSDGTLYVNYHPKVLETPLGPHDEIMLLRSIAKSLIYNFIEVKALVVLVDGAPRHNLGLHMPAHGRYLLPQVLLRKK